MEKRVLFAAVLSAVFLSWYAQTVLKPAARPRPANQPVAEKSSEQPDAPQIVADEQPIFLESDDLLLEVGTKSGAIRSVTLRKFLNEAKTSPLVFRGSLPIVQLRLARGPLSWNMISHTKTGVQFNVVGDNEEHYHISYELNASNSFIDIELSDITHTENLSFAKDILFQYSWMRSDRLNERSNQLEMLVLQKNGNGKEVHKRYIGSPNQTRIVPRGTRIVSLAERYFCQSVRSSESSELTTTLHPLKNGIIWATTAVLPGLKENPTSLQIYFGPRDYFHMKRAGFAEAFKIGALGQIGLILLSLLKWIASITKNYGVAIIVFCTIITAMTAPFTIISFRSMKKMQELKPRIDKLMTQHKDDSTRLNKEIFALYREHKVSPLSGCLPMLLQMPIFIALLQAISHFIDLRGQAFLWIKDLSLPDRLMPLPISLPILGGDLNLLPILMAGAMFAQSKVTQASQAVDPDNPTAKLMSGPFMSIMFGVMFYQFPSGLVLYWLSNSLISMVFYRLAK